MILLKLSAAGLLILEFKNIQIPKPGLNKPDNPKLEVLLRQVLFQKLHHQEWNRYNKNKQEGII